MKDLQLELDLLGYDNQVSERPQDGDQVVHEDTLIFDEEYDMQVSTFSLLEPVKSEEYSQWLSDFINDELNYFTDSELNILNALFAAHYNWVYMMHDLNQSYWRATVETIQDCFNQ